jgi:methylthioribose-1-phosphate isomerase
MSGESIHAVSWEDDALVLIDQTKLPAELEYIRCTDVDTVIDAIVRLAVRGAPALGAVGGYGVVVAMLQGEREGWDADLLDHHITRIRDARPTAVNLAWGVDRVQPLVGEGVSAVLAAAHDILAEDQRSNRELSRLGGDWILEHVHHRPIRVLTHCNTGSLATTGWGTALGIIRDLSERGALGEVFVDETRPLLQGARLTAWELQRDGIDYLVQADGAAASTIMRGLVDVAIIGADRIARNGDTANKIGSVAVALACHAAGIPFVVAAPSSTVDLSTSSGADIHIEERDGREVTVIADQWMTPAGARGFNPAFDVTPAEYIGAIVTERAVVTPRGAHAADELTAHDL